jgi:succinyl-CoA synthetase alpha subunit
VSILIGTQTRLVVQGITGRDGSFHARQMMAYGTNVVAGVTPGKGGQRFEDKVPIFDSVAEAVAATAANTSVIYVPPAGAAGAIYEAVDAGVELVVCITEGVPVLDMTRVMPFVREHGARLIGQLSGPLHPARRRSGSFRPDLHARPGRA